MRIKNCLALMLCLILLCGPVCRAEESEYNADPKRYADYDR